MYSDEVLKHFQNPRNVGRLSAPAVTVEVVNPVCGDIMTLSVRIEEGRVVESAYLTRGCTASIAAGSVLTELIKGKSVEEMAAIRAQDIENALNGLPPESKHAAALGVDALKAVLRKRA
jgi:nitrogen fixation NifU-like protein